MNIGAYYRLTKPGVLFGNVITGIAGFLFAASYYRHFNAELFVATIGGMTLVIASACVLNNVLDHDIDQKMERTKLRATANGDVSRFWATVFSIKLGVAGMIILVVWSSTLVVLCGVIGYITYVWLYGAFTKRKSIHGTVVGSISGAVPIVAGYVAVSGKFDTASAVLFVQLFSWQFPEFYSIAIYRMKEYRAAGVPVISVIKGKTLTSQLIVANTIVFTISTLALTLLGYTGWSYFVIMAAVCAGWLRLAFSRQRRADIDAWARRMFHRSLLAILVLSAALSFGALLP